MAASGGSLDDIERQRSHLVIVLLLVTCGAGLSMAVLQLGGEEALRKSVLGQTSVFRAAPTLLLAGFSLYILEQDRRLRDLTRALFDDRQTITELAHETRHDALTGLPNRKAFTEVLDVALARGRQTGEALALLFVDLDAFKDVNDALGHMAGDAILREVAVRLTAAMPEGAKVARVAGDEFAALLDDGPEPADAFAAADRVQSALSLPVRLEAGPLRLSASTGVVLHTGGTRTSTELLREADLAMYMAKLGGRARWELFDMSLLREPQSAAVALG